MAIISPPVKLSFAALKEFGEDKGTVIWRTTPKIDQSIQVNYQTWELQHTNYQPVAFGNRSTPEITVSGPWISRDRAEAKRTLEAIHLLRSATMMFYGRNDKHRGTPPPIGRFSAYGLYNNTPVVVKSFQYNYPNDVDYISASGPTPPPPGKDIVDETAARREYARFNAMTSLAERDAAQRERDAWHVPAVDSGGFAIYDHHNVGNSLDGSGVPFHRPPATAPEQAKAAAEEQDPDPNMPDMQAVPVLFDMSVTLIVQMNPIEIVKEFELKKFLDGSLLGKGYI